MNDLIFKLNRLLFRVTTLDKLIFTKHIAVMLKSGIPLSEAVDSLKDQTTNLAFKEVLESISKEIENGQSLAVALSKHPKVFDALYLSFVETGANMGFLLRFGNMAVAKLIQYSFGIPKLTDCGCTYRVLNRSLVNKILPFLNVGWSHFLAQLVILTALSNKTILEIPVHYKKRIGTSKITGSMKRAILVGIRMVNLVVKYRLIGKTVFKKSPESN